MSDSVNLKYTPTEDDVVRVSREQFRLVRGNWRYLWVAPVVLLAAMFAFRGNWSGIWQLAAIIAALAVVMLLLNRFLKWSVRKSPHIGVELEMEASTDGMAWNSPLANTRSSWTAYTSVRETAGYFLFHAGFALCAAIPKRAFAGSGDIERFRGLVRAHVQKSRLLDRSKEN